MQSLLCLRSYYLIASHWLVVAMYCYLLVVKAIDIKCLSKITRFQTPQITCKIKKVQYKRTRISASFVKTLTPNHALLVKCFQ